jgi:hypothetical protein
MRTFPGVRSACCQITAVSFLGNAGDNSALNAVSMFRKFTEGFGPVSGLTWPAAT